tara:strand:- start:400 stop:1017 length:618 start_codon:yes stop_codon:yes gene_type:complete
LYYFRRLLEIIGLISIIILISAIFLISKITEPVTVDLKNQYDAIIILSGNLERASRASKLYFEKDAQVVLLSKELASVYDYSNMNHSKKTYELYLDILNNRGIDIGNIILYGTNNESTFDEINELKKLNLKKYSNILIVTDRYHIFRASQLLKANNVAFNYEFYRSKTSAKWYENKKSILIVFSELMKCYLYYIFEDFNTYLDYL